MTRPAVALTIAGSDSGGGAGIQADLHTFARMDTFATTVITAVTAQNTTGVTDVHVVPADTVAAQLDAVLDDLPVGAAKTGMLATAELVALVGDRAAAGQLPALVVDPVLVSATGHRLLEPGAAHAYRERLLPHATVATPNLHEAAVLLDRELATAGDARDAAHELAELGPELVVVKGGHLDGPEAVDVVVAGGEEHELTAERIDTPNSHGTGCTFAAATAAGLAKGLAPLEALREAKAFVSGAIARAAPWRLGSGNGPLDHHGLSSGRD